MNLRLYFLACLLLMVACSEQERSGTVDWVFDADTISVTGEGWRERVRLIGVDAPETRKKQKKGQCYAEEGKRYLIDRLKGKGVRLVGERGREPRDRYGRLLAYVYLGQELINRTLITEGYAKALTFFPFKLSDDFVKAEAQARDAGRGLWAACR